jgi:hypothetical protein
VREGERPEAIRERPAGALCDFERLEQAIERAILAEKQNLVLAAEVVVQVGGRQVGGDGDVAHAGGGIAVRSEYPCGGAQDCHPAGVGANRTPVRNSNHRSILPRGRPGM